MIDPFRVHTTRHPDLYADIGRIADVGRCIDGRALAPAHSSDLPVAERG